MFNNKILYKNIRNTAWLVGFILLLFSILFAARGMF